MSIKDKYNIPQPVWQALVKDGVITSRVSRAEDILSCYSSKRQSGTPHTEAVKSTAHEMEASETWVYIIVRRFS